MARKPQITNRQLETCLKHGMSPAEIAKKYGADYHTIYNRLRKIKDGASRDLVLYQADTFLARELDSLEQLQTINTTANDLLSLLAAAVMGDDEAKADALKTLGARQQGDTDPKQLILKCCQEIRAQLALQFDFFKALYDMRAVADFQNNICKLISRTVCADCGPKIVEALHQMHALRLAVRPEGLNDK